MRKRLAFLFLILALSFPALACQLTERVIRLDRVRGSGQVVEENRNIGEVSRVNLAGLGTLNVEIGDSPSLRIEAEDNILPLIETDVNGDTLRIGMREGSNPQPTKDINYYLTVPSLEGIVVSGLGDAKIPELQSGSFEATISGGGNIDLAGLTADDLEVVISGLGDLSIAGGQIERQTVTISGGGNYDARGLESREAQIQISGLGNATIQVSDNLNVNISGGGDVRYLGNPSVQSNISGLGNVEPIE